MNHPFCLSNVYSDQMIFQRGKPIRFTGWAPVRTEIRCFFEHKATDALYTKVVFSDATGAWEVEFPAQEAGEGWEARFSAPPFNTETLCDIAIGEVWFCSGQSNMEFPVCGIPFYSLTEGPKLAAAAHDHGLRLLFVKHAVSPDGPCDDLAAGCAWRTAETPEAVRNISGVGYHFGMMLRKKLGIPVGIVSCSWGGSRIEPWISEEAFRRNGCEGPLEQIRSARSVTAVKPGASGERGKAFREQARVFDRWLAKFEDAAAAAEARASWAAPDADESAWTKGTFAEDGKAPPFRALAKPGIFWYRFHVTLPNGWEAEGSRVTAITMDDVDEVFWDGAKIGETTVRAPSYWEKPRSYAIPKAAARPGEHVLCVRLQDHFNCGRIVGLQVVESTGRALPLMNKVGLERVESRPSPELESRPMTPWDLNGVGNLRLDYELPSTLFNGMVAPLTRFRYRGVLWYQGCSNAMQWKEYAKYHEMLVRCWRKAMGCPDMAFLAVQLAGFERHSPTDRLPDGYWKGRAPTESSLAEIRREQTKIRRLPLCAVATATDIGDASDIHPANKKEVARRLAALAGSLCYGEKGVAEGPIAVKAKREGGAIRVLFDNVGAGLVCKGGRGFGEQAFALAGADGVWAWADAKIDGDTVVVSSSAVPAPRRVRYAWAAYPPNMRLFNRDGFPAGPFEL